MVVAGMALGTNAVLLSDTYAAGATVAAVLAIRYTGALCVVTPLAFRNRSRAQRIGLWRALAVAGGAVGSTITYWGALSLAPVTDVTPLAFAYPAIVAVIGVVFLGDRLTVIRVLTIAVAVGGSFMIFGAPSAGSGNLGAQALAFLSGLCAAVYLLAGAHWVASSQAFESTAMICLLGACVFVPVAVLTGTDWSVLEEVWPYLLAITVAGTVLPFVLMQMANARLGATRTALLSLLEPVVAILLAVVLLDEAIGGWQLAGSVLILASFPLMAIETARRDQRLPEIPPTPH